MPHIYLRDKCYNFEQLPSIPSLLVELLDLCHDASCNFAQIAKSIEKDPGLTSKIIQLANSVLFRQWNDVTEVKRMLVVLGMDNVRQIVISSAVHQLFANCSKEFDQHVQHIWVRAQVCSSLAQRLAQLIGYQKPQEAYLAGLLYQLGQLLLLLNHEQTYRPMLEQYEPTSDFCQLEKIEFGSDHCELGAALVESWQLESFIADAILFQKAPTEELRNAPTLIKIIAVSSLLSSSSDNDISPAALERAGVLFDLTESSTLECLATAKIKALQVVKELGLESKFSPTTKGLCPADTGQSENSKAQLASRLKDLVLTSGQRNLTPTPDNDLVKNLRATFEILFNIKALFFIRTSNADNLTVVNDLGLNQLDEFSFNAADHDSILVKSLHAQSPLDSFSEVPSIMDKQLIRLLKTTGVHFFPLQHNAEVLGIIALGVSEAQHLELREKNNLLKLLCKDIGRNLLPAKEQQPAKPGISYDQLSRITHELSNPLTIIKNYLYVLSKKIGQEHAAHEEIAFMDEEIDRVANILLRAKDPANGAQKEGCELDINKLIFDLDKLLGDSLYKTAGIRSRLQLDENILPLSCPRDKTKQILINIIKNATEAMPEGGMIELSTRDSIYQNATEYVEIAIKDNGPGIPRAVLPQLFKPVESTKEGHSGVGLSIVNNLISEISGLIFCCSSPENGTEFKIYLPRTLCLRQME
jgi:HD-like signal output (HDOD) protein/signal transduction histidine kinase